METATGMTLQSTIATVNGYRLRYVQDSRFGRLVAVDGTNKAFATIDDAVAFANLAGQFKKSPLLSEDAFARAGQTTSLKLFDDGTPSGIRWLRSRLR